MEESSLTKDTLIKSAWSSRDAAVAKKNVVEVELARGRVEGVQVGLVKLLSFITQLSSQLIEAGFKDSR